MLFAFTLRYSLKTREHLIFLQKQFNLTLFNSLIILFKTTNALPSDLQQNVVLSLPVDGGLEETGELKAEVTIL